MGCKVLDSEYYSALALEGFHFIRTEKYDSLGNRIRTAQDLNGNGTADSASADRVDDEGQSLYWMSNGFLKFLQKNIPSSSNLQIFEFLKTCPLIFG
jgi:hypothetical protein